MPKIEICAQSLTSALAAQEGGADRIELCTALEVGGVTPSPSTILEARKRLQIPIAVLVRPRAGDFVHSDLEFELICQDVLFCKNHGIDAVVVGILRENGAFDADKMRRLRDLAYPMDIASHRAFDQTPDPFEALEQLIDWGYDRILTSGQARNVVEGRDILRSLVAQAGERITIMPGNGVSPDNLADLMAHTGAPEFHLTAKSLVKSRLQVAHSDVQFNLDGGRENDYFESDVAIIRRAVAIAKGGN